MEAPQHQKVGVVVPVRELSQMSEAAPDVPPVPGQDSPPPPPSPPPLSLELRSVNKVLVLSSPVPLLGVGLQARRPPPLPNLVRAAVVVCLWPLSPAPPHTPCALPHYPSLPPPGWLGHDLIRAPTGRERV